MRKSQQSVDNDNKTCPHCSGRAISVLPLYENKVLVTGIGIICHERECGKATVLKGGFLISPLLRMQLELFRISGLKEEKTHSDFTGWLVPGEDFLVVEIEDPCGQAIKKLPDKWRFCAKLPVQGEENKFIWPDIIMAEDIFVLKFQ